MFKKVIHRLAQAAVRFDSAFFYLSGQPVTQAFEQGQTVCLMLSQSLISLHFFGISLKLVDLSYGFQYPLADFREKVLNLKEQSPGMHYTVNQEYLEGMSFVGGQCIAHLNRWRQIFWTKLK